MNIGLMWVFKARPIEVTLRPGTSLYFFVVTNAPFCSSYVLLGGYLYAKSFWGRLGPHGTKTVTLS